MIDTAAEEKLKQLHSKPRQLDLIMDTLGGRLLHGRLVFQQHFLIRSNELDPDGKVSIVAVVNLLQLQLESNREKILAFAIANHFILLYNVNMIDTAAEEKLKQLHSKPRQLDLIMDTLGGRLLHGRLVFQQHFLIRSNELDPDGKVSIVAVVNLLQESALNHLRSVGLLADGFGSTPEMHRRDLIWVAYRLQIEVERLSSW
nr:palmitoyl-acyl carrier protein thioesterase, chloroplastic [Quercus suber]